MPVERDGPHWLFFAAPMGGSDLPFTSLPHHLCALLWPLECSSGLFWEVFRAPCEPLCKAWVPKEG